MEGESGEQVGGELESVTSSAGCFVQGWRNEMSLGGDTSIRIRSDCESTAVLFAFDRPTTNGRHSFIHSLHEYYYSVISLTSF